MKTDRTVKAGSGSRQARTVKRAGRTASKPTTKSNGKHLLTAYEYAPVGVVEVSPQGSYINVNDAFCRITGYSKTKLRKLTFEDITHPEDRAAETALYQQLASGKIPFYRLEKRYVRKDGTVLWVELTRSVVRGADGEILHTVGIVLDISERKKSEAQLRWQAQLLAELGDAVIATDSDFLVTGWNAAAERIYGWKADEVLGKSVDAVLQTDLLGKSFEQVEAETRRTGEFEGEVLQLRRDGTRVMLETRTVAMRDDRGAITGYVSVNRDVTQRKQAEQALRESQQRLAATYQYAPVGIVQCTPQGRYFDANEEFCRLLGFEKDELLQGGIKEFTHEDDYPIDIKLHQQLVAGKIPYYRLEKRFLREDGGYTWVELTRSLVRAEDGTPLYTIGAVLDISDRKHVERVLRDSVERLRLATQAARMFMWEWDILNQLYTADDSFEQVLGFSGGLLPRGTADSVQELIHPDDRQALSKAASRAIESRTDLHSLQIRVVNPEDGQIVWLEISGKVIYDEEGKAVRILGVSQNITESKRTQEEIAVISRLPAQNPNPVMRISPQGAILYANPASAPLLEDWQKQADQAIPEELQTAVREGFDRDTRIEVELAHGDSYFSCTLAPIREAGYVNFYGKDITERKRAENTLAEFARQQEALYHLSDRLHRTDSLEEVYDAALDAILSALQCSRASILLFDDKDVMRFVAWRGLSDAYRGATDGHSPWTPDSRDPYPISIDDIQNSDLDEPLRTVIEAEGIGALAFIPLVFHGKLIGKFMVYYDGVHRFSEEDIELSLTIAYQLAAGIERKRADVQLRQSEERYRAVVESQVEMVCRFEPDGKILFVNSAYARARGAIPEDLIGRNFWDFVSVEDRPFVKAMLEKLTPEVPEIHIENRFHTLDGERWTLWTNRGLKFDASGRLLEAQSSGIDITERKNAEEELQRSEERERMRAAQLEAIMEAAPAVIWMATDPQCSVITGNRASYEILRLSPGTNTSLSAPEADRPTGFTLLSGGRVLPVDELPVQRAARGEEVRDLELEICFDDSSVYLLGNATPLRDTQNNPTGSVAVFVDITARKQAEQRLALLAEISELTREFDDPDELMYSVSKRVGEHLRVSRCLFNETDVESDREFVHRDYHDGVPSVAGVHSLSDYSSSTSAEMQAGKTVVNKDSKIDPRTAQDYERTYGPNQERAYVAIPLMRGDRWVASFWVSDSQPRDWTRDEVSLLETIAERTWTVVEKLRITQILRASEALYRTIARSIPGGSVYVVDKNFRYLVAEGSVTESFGLTREMLEGHTVMDAFPDERGRRMEERLKRTFAGETVSFETKHNERVYWTQLAPLYNSLGQAIILTLDITERKQAEEALRESEERFRAILRQATAGIVRKDAEGRLVFVNQAFCNMLGYTEAELLGKTMWDFMHEQDVEENRRLYQQMMTEGLPFKLERRLLREDGSIIWVDASVSPIMDAQGRPQSAVTVEVDITGRKLAEEALRRNEKMFSTLVDAAPFGVYFIDSEFRLRAINKGSEEVFSGIDPLIGRDFAEILRIVWPEPFATSAIERFRHTLRTGESFISPPVVEKRGNIQEIQAYDWQIHRITLADGTYGVVCYFYDLTEQMRMEAAVRASEERYRNLFELVPVAVYSCDASGLIQEYNYRAVELWGREPARNDPRDRYCGSYRLFYPDGRPMPHEECPMARVLRGESLEPHQLEVVVEREDRTRRSVIAHPLLLKDEQGEIIGAINCLYDFTERKQAEEALQQLNAQLEDRVLSRTAKLRAVNERLREEIVERRKAEDALRESEAAARANEKKLSTLFDLLPVGISFLDPQGKIIQMNPALANILKLPQGQPPDQVARARRYIRADGSLMQPGEFASARAFAEARTIYNTESGVVLENGETIWTSVSAAPVAVADVGAAVVTVDITERKQAERALQESRERLQILSQRLVEVQEEERRAIARELHDRVGQTLAALNINLIIISGQLEGKVDEQIGARLSDSMKLVAETITLVRDVMSNLRPSVLDDYGLEAALQSHIDEYMSRYEIRVMLQKPEQPLPRLGPSIEMTFLRIAQEALMNIVRHAQASHVDLTLSRDGEAVCMVIQDNGKGIQSWQDASRPGSHGLTIMRERAEAFGGVFQVSSAPGQGTRIEVRIPFEHNSLPQSREEMQP